VWVNSVTASELALKQTSPGALEVAWHQDIAKAWEATQQNGRPLLVFVTRDQCYYCDKMKAGTLVSPLVVASVKAAFVPLILDGRQQSPLLKELNVRGYPSTFVISPQAVVLDRIDGYVTPEVLASRLKAIRPRPPSEKLASDP
jgi:protein disulfide-isomerase